MPWNPYVTRSQLNRALDDINERIERMADSEQAHIDADTAQAKALNDKLNLIQQQVDALKAQPGVAGDFSALDAALAADTAQADVDVADSAPATPPGP